jgi:hypothetical protein
VSIEPPFHSDETFGARLMRESIEDNERRRAEERIEPPIDSDDDDEPPDDDDVEWFAEWDGADVD